MGSKTKAIIVAVLALLSAVMGWYVAHSDNDATTKPDTQSVISAGTGVVKAVTAEEVEVVEVPGIPTK